MTSSTIKFPTVDLDAVFGLQKANVATMQDAQNVVLEAAQAVARVQYGFVEESVAEARTVLNVKEPKKAEAVVADVKTAGEKAVAVAKQTIDITVAAQRRVAELFTQRAQANAQAVKDLFAAAQATAPAAAKEKARAA